MVYKLTNFSNKTVFPKKVYCVRLIFWIFICFFFHREHLGLGLPYKST